MTIEAWLACVAVATALLLVPHPLASLTATYARSWGRASACITVAASIVAISLVGTTIAAAIAVLVTVMPALAPTLSWAGIGYLMLYVLYAYQEPQFRQGPADNDNLAETRPWRIVLLFAKRTFKNGRYFAFLGAGLCQFLGQLSPRPQDYLQLLAALTVAAAIAALAYALIPRLSARKKRIANPGKAPHKPGTLFIARRAVTAGYRRIAA
jgi:homoserine/homoserine lactone efflux protein